MIATLRALSFYVGYMVLTIIWGSLSVLVAWLLPYRVRFAFIIGFWTRAALWWLGVTCGIRGVVEGREHIPREACVVLANHESTWETLFLQSLFAPQATVVKRELLWIPFFGWAFATTRPIAIDRSNPRQALRRFIQSGRERLDAGIWVVLFPEGTRTDPGVVERFQAGGAALAAAAGAPVLVVAHDAGRYWPAHRLQKRPGTVRVRIAAPIDCHDQSTKSINEQAHATMTRLVTSLYDGAGNPMQRRPVIRPG
jgi:1-acyl-sn-glycerol-3-phosphate acyltransferase